MSVGLAALGANLVNSLHDRGTHFRRQRTANSKPTEIRQYLVLSTEGQKFDYSKPDLAVRVIFDSPNKWLNLASFGHQKQERKCIVCLFPSLPCKVSDRFGSEPRTCQRGADSTPAI